MRSAAHSAQRGKPLMIKKFGAVALAAAIALQCVPAMANGIMVEANGARAHGRWGGELGLGYTLSAGGFSLRPIVGAFIYQGDNDRYYEDDLSNDKTRCRDSTNGQFAKDDLYDNTAVKAYGKLEVHYSITPVAAHGGGARVISALVDRKRVE